MIDALRDQFQPLYETGGLLGFAIFSDGGEVQCNDTMWADEVLSSLAGAVTNCFQGLAQSEREVRRLSFRMHDCFLVVTPQQEGYICWVMEREANLDAAVAEVDSILAGF